MTGASSLHRALAAAGPGSVIELAPGTFHGHFTATAMGSEQHPIVLCGPKAAVLDGGGIHSGYTLHLDHAAWWQVTGFTVTGGQKGIVTDHATHLTLRALNVHGVGDEGVHLRSFSSDNTVQDVVIRDTGLLVAKFGEGIYVGSAHSNWCRYSGCGPDASDHNVLKGNDIARTTAENIDIKEGTSAGSITGNRLSGIGMVPSAATAWVNVKGNDWTISANRGQHSPKDGFQVHRVYPGWGMHNVFAANHAVVDGPGYGIYVQHADLAAVVNCDNQAIGAASGLSNIACTSGP